MQRIQAALMSGTSTHRSTDGLEVRLAPLFALAAVVLLPWIVLLALVLPSTHRAEHWGVAWAGFDVMLALLLLAVAITAWRRSTWLEGAATAAATLLFVDAWLDVLTSSTQAELVMAIVEAAVVELPLAVVCLLVARSAKRRLRLQPIAFVRERSEAPLTHSVQASRRAIMTIPATG
jgi:hypothetical protein